MKLMRAVRVLASLGLAGAFAMGSVGAAAQTAAPAGAPKIGSSLIGKLQGPEIIRDAKAFPKTFKEAPTLAALVKDGKLPAVDKRLPEPSQLFVVKPLDQIGKYGGNWRRAFTGPADHENGNRIVSADKILTFDYITGEGCDLLDPAVDTVELRERAKDVADNADWPAWRFGW